MEGILKVSQTCLVFGPRHLASNANLRHCLGKSDATHTHTHEATIALVVKAGLLNVSIRHEIKIHSSHFCTIRHEIKKS